MISFSWHCLLHPWSSKLRSWTVIDTWHLKVSKCVGVPVCVERSDFQLILHENSCSSDEFNSTWHPPKHIHTHAANHNTKSRTHKWVQKITINTSWVWLLSRTKCWGCRSLNSEEYLWKQWWFPLMWCTWKHTKTHFKCSNFILYKETQILCSSQLFSVSSNFRYTKGPWLLC